MSESGAPQDQPILTSDSRFRFACHENLPCFTQCCRDVNIYLTPYDVLRLRQSLNLSSKELLSRYTRYILPKKTNFPLVQLAMDEQTKYCKLVTPEGCSVYADRPWACRMYPVDLADTTDRYCMIVGSDRCKGLLERREWTVDQWMEHEGVRDYVEMEQVFQTMFPPELYKRGKLDIGLGKLIFLTYDLDQFEQMLDDPRFQRVYGVEAETVRKAKEDPVRMLKLAIQYVRAELEDLL